MSTYVVLHGYFVAKVKNFDIANVSLHSICFDFSDVNTSVNTVASAVESTADAYIYLYFRSRVYIAVKRGRSWDYPIILFPH